MVVRTEPRTSGLYRMGCIAVCAAMLVLQSIYFSMYGDVGFAEHPFQCNKCRFRFQHRYCSRGYLFGDHIELCDWCFVESDRFEGFTDNFHSSTESKPILTKKADEASAFNPKRKGNEARTSGLYRMDCSMCGDVGFAEHLFQYVRRCWFCRASVLVQQMPIPLSAEICSRGYLFGDHIELCDWCFVESDRSDGSTDNFHSSTESKPILTKKGDEASAFSPKRKGNEARLTVKCNYLKANMAARLMRSASKTKVRNTRFVPPRCLQRMKLLQEILC